MPEKAQLEEELNEILDMQIEWSKLKKDDLELILELAESGALLEPLAKHQAKEHGKNKLDDMVEDWFPGKYAGGLL